MSIIGINGKINSGKDTVGKIVQYLTSECGDINNKSYRDYESFVSRGGGSAPRQHDFHYQSNWEIKKFAGKLKEVASLLTRVRMEYFEDQEFKKLNMDSEWDYELIGEDWIDGKPQKRPMTYRDFLQKLGTDAMREGLHENVWVNALMSDYHPPKMDQYYPSKWIITDMRFPNEMDAVVKRKGITIRVVRYPKTVKVSRGPQDIETIPFDPTNQKHMDLWKGESSRLHPSETSLDSAEFDYTIVNDSTIEELVKKVKEILKEEGII